MKKPLLGAGFVLAAIWFFCLMDIHPRFLSLSKATTASDGSSWLLSWRNDGSYTEDYEEFQIEDDLQQHKGHPLILFAFYDTPLSRKNLEFFLHHGLHDNADFIFIINGESNVTDIIPSKKNIKIVQRENDCFDLGAFAEVLTRDDLYLRYDEFITMNASVRGPFFPHWSNACWSDMYLNRLTEKVKLVGMSLGCLPVPHVQSMVWATDRTGLETLLYPSDTLISKFKTQLPPHNNDQPVPPITKPGINQCPDNYWAAVAVEVFATSLLRSAGYEIDVLMSAYHGISDYEHACSKWMDGDMLSHGHYWGMNMHPFDTIFTKTNRQNDPLTLEKLTEWIDRKNYSSSAYCHSKTYR